MHCKLDDFSSAVVDLYEIRLLSYSHSVERRSDFVLNSRLALQFLIVS